MITKLLILLLLLLAPANTLLMQEIPECMCVPLSYPPTGQPTNMDSSCVIDTCGIWYPSKDCDSAFWNNTLSKYGEEAKKRVYAKRFWEILFEVPAIPIPPAPYTDTIIYVDWTAIDTAYMDIRNAFQQMEENFGDLYFRKLFPTDDENSKRFRLYYTNYVNIDSITKIGRQIPGITVFDFAAWPYRSPEDYVHDNINDFTFSISPNPASEYIEINSGADSRRHTADGRQEIQIFNVYGKSVISVETGLRPVSTQRIDISNLPVGFYFVRYGNTVKSFVVLR